MKIAILISGRASRYDVCLLPLLQSNSHIDIDVFMAINDENEDCNYYNIMKLKLNSWLKSCIIKKYTIPEETMLVFNPNESISHTLNYIQANLQKINNKFLPYNCLSMYYNDNLSFKLACEYADNNNFEYDYYVKYRSDIINNCLPEFNKISDDIQLQSVVPICNFMSNGLHRHSIVSDAFAYGNRKTMEFYCNTYDFVIKKNKEYNGKYFIAYECSLTDNIYENKVPISYFKIPYSLDANRRMFDNVHDDSRTIMPKQQYFFKNTDDECIKYIKAEKQN